MGRKRTTFWPPGDEVLFTEGLQRKSRRYASRPPAALAPATITGIRTDYGTSLKWLAVHGSVDVGAMPATRWNHTTVDGMITSMIEAGRATATVLSRVGRLKSALKIMQPTSDLNYIDALLRELERPQPKFDPVVWQVTAADLQAFGIELMSEAEALDSADELAAADRYRAGLQIALITARPLRRRTFTLLELWTHLKRTGDDWRIEASASDTKTRRPLTASIPKKLRPHLERYLEKSRPILCQGKYMGQALWVTKRARPQTGQLFYRSFVKLTRAKFGTRVTVALVRKIVATTIAIYNPKQVHAIMGLCGHIRLSTGEDHYNMAHSLGAFDRLDDVIAEAAGEPKRKSRGRNT